MFKYFHLALVIWTLAHSTVQAETYIRDYTYKASDIDSKVTSRTNALDQVKLILLQEIGTHIRQEINITNDGASNSYASEDVEAITAGLTSVEIIEEKWNGMTYYLKAKIDADTTRVLNALNEFKNKKTKESKQQLAALKDNQRKLKASRKETASLRKQLTQANANKKERVVIKYVDRVNQILLLGMATKGYNFEQQGKLIRAFYWYRKAADQGSAYAQSNLGAMYLNGKGVQQNYKQAIAWYRKAVEQGLASAQNNLGAMYASGKGVEKNDKQAVIWYRKAAEQGDAPAQNNLGIMYGSGRGIEKNDKQAVIWYRKAVEQGWASAQNNLRVMYGSGKGVEQSYSAAVAWIRKSAEQGDAYSQKQLGSMYKNGAGIEQSDKKAKAWFKKSCNNGYKQACPYTSYAAGVDAILLLPASCLIALILAIISIAISNKKLVILYIHLGSAAFYLFARLALLPGLLGLVELGEVKSIIGFSFLILYPLLSSCCILILSIRWRFLAKRSSVDR